MTASTAPATGAQVRYSTPFPSRERGPCRMQLVSFGIPFSRWRGATAAGSFIQRMKVRTVPQCNASELDPTVLFFPTNVLRAYGEFAGRIKRHDPHPRQGRHPRSVVPEVGGSTPTHAMSDSRCSRRRIPNLPDQTEFHSRATSAGGSVATAQYTSLARISSRNASTSACDQHQCSPP